MFYAVKVVYEIFDRVNATGIFFRTCVQVNLIKEWSSHGYLVILLLLERNNFIRGKNEF